MNLLKIYSFMGSSVVVQWLFADRDAAGMNTKSPTACSNSWIMLERLMLHCFTQSTLTFHYSSVVLWRGREWSHLRTYREK